MSITDELLQEILYSPYGLICECSGGVHELKIDRNEYNDIHDRYPDFDVFVCNADCQDAKSDIDDYSLLEENDVYIVLKDEDDE